MATDLIDEVHGRLTVMARGKRTPAGEWMWACKCECGQWCMVAGKNLGRDTRSCGCLRSEEASRRRIARGKSQRRKIGERSKEIPPAPENETRLERAIRYRSLRGQGYTLREIAESQAKSRQYISAESRHFG